MSNTNMGKAVFNAIVNPYHGCYIGLEQLPVVLTEHSIGVFNATLANSIQAWQQD